MTLLFRQKENIFFMVAEFREIYGVNIFGKGLKEKYDAGNFSTLLGISMLLFCDKIMKI